MLISEQEKQRILSMHIDNGYKTINKSSEVLFEQNLFSRLLSKIRGNITKWFDIEGEKTFEKYITKSKNDERSFTERVSSWLDELSKKPVLSQSEKDLVSKLIKSELKSSPEFRKQYVMDNVQKWKSKEKTLGKEKVENIIRGTYGDEVYDLYSQLRGSKFVLSDVLSSRVEQTIKDEKVKTELENFLKLTFNDKNYSFEWDPTSKKQVCFFISATGNKVRTTYLDWYIKGHVSGHETGLNDNLDKLPRKLADGTEFRSKIKTILDKDIPDFDLSEIPPMDLREKWRIDTNPNESPDDLMNRQFDLIRKLVDECNQYEGIPFDQRKIKIIGKQYVSGRNVFEIELPKGDKILCYESSGSNTETTGKKNGEWFVLPGFGKLYKDGQLISDTWFIKTKETVSITANNSYFKDLDMYLRAIHGYQ